MTKTFKYFYDGKLVRTSAHSDYLFGIRDMNTGSIMSCSSSLAGAVSLKNAKQSVNSRTTFEIVQLERRG